MRDKTFPSDSRKNIAPHGAGAETGAKCPLSRKNNRAHGRGWEAVYNFRNVNGAKKPRRGPPRRPPHGSCDLRNVGFSEYSARGGPGKTGAGEKPPHHKNPGAGNPRPPRDEYQKKRGKRQANSARRGERPPPQKTIFFGVGVWEKLVFSQKSGGRRASEKNPFFLFNKPGVYPGPPQRYEEHEASDGRFAVRVPRFERDGEPTAVRRTKKIPARKIAHG